MVEHPDLSDRIRTLREKQRGNTEAAHEATVTGESAIIAALRRQLRDTEQRHRTETAALRARIKEQDRQIAALYGQLAPPTGR